MKKTDAIKMVRKIRDQQNKDTAGMSRQDIIAYFRKKSVEINGKAINLEVIER